MSIQKFNYNKSSIGKFGKLSFIGAIVIWGIFQMLFTFSAFYYHHPYRPLYHLSLFSLFALYLPFACGATYSYLMKAQPQITVKKPRLAGILMLISVLLIWFCGSWLISLLTRWVSGFFFIDEEFFRIFILIPLFIPTSFLIPGGILALINQQRKKTISKKMALGLSGIFFIAPLLGIFIGLFSYFIFYRVTQFLGF